LCGVSSGGLRVIEALDEVLKLRAALLDALGERLRGYDGGGLRGREVMVQSLALAAASACGTLCESSASTSMPLSICA
jgi:hypothetical protein